MYLRDIHAEANRPAATSASRPQAVHLRPIDPMQARLNQCIGMALHAELPLGATTVRLEASAPQAATRPSSARPLRLQTPAGMLAITPAREVVRALTSIDLPEEHETDPLHALRMDVAAQAMPAGWLPLFGASSAVTETAGDASDAFEVSLSIFQPQVRLGLTATLRGSAAALLHALSQPGWQRLHDSPTLQAPPMPLRVPVRIGTTTLPLSTVQALVKGDVVPVAHPLFDLEGVGQLRIASGMAKVVLQLGNQPCLELTEWHPTPKGQTMNDLLDSSPDTGTDDALDDLPVTLSFDLGALEVTLAQLKSLGPGSVLPLTGSLPPQVLICSGQHRVGMGELVELEGRLAVQIRRIGAMS